MKKAIGIVVVLLILLYSGCKKDTSSPATVNGFCKNTCYLCYMRNNISSTDTFCNTNNNFADRWEIDSLIGYVCKEISPTIIHQYTGTEQQVDAAIAADTTPDLHCYHPGETAPAYFDYAAFVARHDRCQACYDTIALHYAEFFFDTVGKLTHFCADCISSAFLDDTLPLLVQYAANQVSGMHCGSPNSPSRSITGYVMGKVRQMSLDTYCNTCPVTVQDHNKWVQLCFWIDFNPAINHGLNPVIFRECN